MEQFAIDLDVLVAARLPEARTSDSLQVLPLKQRLTAAARRLLEEREAASIHDRVATECDTVRAIGGLAIAHAEHSPLDRLQLLQPFAEDSHFAVREWAWIGLRDALGDGVLALVPELETWADARSDLTRRFASEVLRPRGVWCRHIRPLRDDPSLALPVIERLKADPSRYVQLSVGNWLNDASVARSEWVETLCARWTRGNVCAATEVITRRGMRTIRRRQASALNVPSS